MITLFIICFLTYSIAFTDDFALRSLLDVAFARDLGVAKFVCLIFGILLGLVDIWLLVVFRVILLSSHTFSKNSVFLSIGWGKLLGSWLSKLFLLFVFDAPTLLITSYTCFDCSHKEVKFSCCFLLGLLAGECLNGV